MNKNYIHITLSRISHLQNYIEYVVIWVDDLLEIIFLLSQDRKKIAYTVLFLRISYLSNNYTEYDILMIIKIFI